MLTRSVSRLAVAIATIAAATVAPATALPQPDPRRGPASNQDPGTGQQASEPAEASWEFQLSARGGVASMSVSGEDILTVPPGLGPPVSEFYVGEVASPKASWGGGFRALRGRFGVDVQYQHTANSDLTPGTLTHIELGAG